jgi:hypothetical protein
MTDGRTDELAIDIPENYLIPADSQKKSPGFDITATFDSSDNPFIDLITFILTSFPRSARITPSPEQDNHLEDYTKRRYHGGWAMFFFCSRST